MSDPTEPLRRALVSEINTQPGSREDLESKYGQVWNTEELQKEFNVLGFMAPIIAVRRKSDGKKGGMMFQHNPRFYWGFEVME